MDKKMIEQILKGGNVRSIIAESSETVKGRFFEDEGEETEVTYGQEEYDPTEEQPKEDVSTEELNANDIEIVCPDCNDGTLDCIIDVDGFGYFQCSNCSCKFELSKVEEPAAPEGELLEPAEPEDTKIDSEEEEEEESVEDLEEACNKKRKTK